MRTFTAETCRFRPGEQKLTSCSYRRGPGAEEDEQGIAFVGKAGRLLTQILASVGIEREDIFIMNIVKCRPPGNRVPSPDEMMACSPFLEAQLRLPSSSGTRSLPGNTPTRWLLRTSEGITALREDGSSGAEFPSLLPMFHPSYLLRNESRKKGSPKELTWRDINSVKKKLDSLNKEIRQSPDRKEKN